MMGISEKNQKQGFRKLPFHTWFLPSGCWDLVIFRRGFQKLGTFKIVILLKLSSRNHRFLKKNYFH